MKSYSLTHAFAATFLMLLGGLAATEVVHAQSEAASAYPSRHIAMILPYSAGGSGDKFGRILGRAMEKRLGQPVVIEFKPGGGTNIGTDFVVHAKPDGYTLLLAGTPLTINPFLYKKLPFSIDDLAPISIVSISPYLLVVGSSVPAKTLPEFIAYAKKNPDKVSYASAGIGSGAHMGGALLNLVAGLNMSHVPYKSSSQGLTDIIGGSVQMTLTPLVVGTPMVESGRLRALAVTSLKRSKSLPNTPTIAEQGYPRYEVLGWYGIMAPKATPPDILRKLNEVIVASLQEPDVVKALEVDGIELKPGSPEEFAAFIKRTAADSAAFVKATGATAE